MRGEVRRRGATGRGEPGGVATSAPAATSAAAAAAAAAGVAAAAARAAAGKFRFEEIDAAGVERLGTEWVPVEMMGADPDWGEKEDEFDELVREERAPFA